jgi:phosphatidylserine synthase
MIAVIIIVLVVAGVVLYSRRRTTAQRSNDLNRWIVVTTVGMIAFLLLGMAWEGWYMLWFLLSGLVLLVLLGVRAVLRWRGRTVA